MQRKKFLLRVDPDVYAAMHAWAADELRSVNAQIEYALREALRRSGRIVSDGQLPRRGRPPARRTDG